MYRAIEKELIKWKTNKPRFPLILRGARQVGKTYIVEKLGKENFYSFVAVNFEAQPEAIACFDSLDPEEILLRLQSILKQPIRPGETLLFLDEIQAAPRAILALRYFKEKLPELHVIGAGSLLEFTLSQGEFSFPVGRVQFIYLKPLSFQEYLLARGKKFDLNKFTLKNPPTFKQHQELMKLVREYFLVGGMPAAVSVFCESLSVQDSARIHDILLSTYQADFSKYATPAEQKHLKILFEGIFQLVGQQFKYSKIDPDMRSRELKTALNHLEWAGLITPIYSCSASGLPLMSQIKRTRFKMLFLDIGLVQKALQISPEDVLDGDLIQINRGMIAEQFVGQELLAYNDPLQESHLFFWEREKKGSPAEVDFLYTIQGKIIPIEVKAGPHGKLKSLRQFMQEKHSVLGVHVSQHPLAFAQDVLSIPFYLLSKLPEILKDLL